jgi:hypothetical protein
MLEFWPTKNLAYGLLREARVRRRWVKARGTNGPNEGLEDVKPLAYISVYTVTREIAKEKK